VSTLSKGLIVGAAQILLLAGVGAKFLYDRATYPRLWVESAPYDPYLPVRGRYVSIALVVPAARVENATGRGPVPGCSARDSRCGTINWSPWKIQKASTS
jgi:hypothetical protein